MTFIALRSLVVRIGFPVTNNRPSATEVAVSNRNTLQRMADAGMDMSVDQLLDFWHRFKTRKNAESMNREARQLGYRVGPIETNNESGGYDVQVRIKLVPTLEAVNKAEQTLASLAERNGGHNDGWGSK